MNLIDETMLMSLFSCYKEKVIAENIFEKYNISNPQVVKADLRDADWQGFIASPLEH